MPRTTKRRASSATRGRSKGKTPPVRAAAPAPPGPARVHLREPPHAHAVCARCGRIVEVVVTPFDAEQLRGLASDGPDGWSIEGLSLSLTGACGRCLAGLPPA
jgi:hypothetical protein